MSMPSCARGSHSHDGKRNYAMVQFLLQIGLQLDECSQLMLSDISVIEPDFIGEPRAESHTMGEASSLSHLLA